MRTTNTKAIRSTVHKQWQRTLAIAVIFVLTLTSLAGTAPLASAQGETNVVVSLGDYVVTPGAEFEVVITVDPADADVAAVQLEVSYDPSVITPVLHTDPETGSVGSIVCVGAANLVASCGPVNPTDFFIVSVFSAAANLSGPTDVVSIPFRAASVAGVSPLEISDVLSGVLERVPTVGVDGSVTVEESARADRCNDKEITIDMRDGASGIGTDGDDVIMGTFFSDTIDGRGGNDTICSRGGDDVVSGGNGEDWIHAGAGDDIVEGNYGDDQIDGSRGNDELRGNGGNDTVIGGSGNDMVRGNLGDDVLIGGSGDDELSGANGVDELFGGAGNDFLRGGYGDDDLFGNRGDDRLVDRFGDNLYAGGDGLDECTWDLDNGASFTGCELLPR